MGLQELALAAGGRPRTAPSLIADVLREAIVSGTLQPGAPLRQEEIAGEFGVSRIPVREALRQLEGEALVKMSPHRGAVVADFSLAELDELCDIRIALETLATRLAVPRLTEEDIARVGAVIDQADTANTMDARMFATNNWEFHATLYEPAARPRLFALIQNLHVHFERYVRVYFALMGVSEASQTEHRRIVAAAREGDPERTADLVRQDISGMKEVIGAIAISPGSP